MIDIKKGIEDFKELVEEIVEYTRNYSISETEWFWNIESVRKPNNSQDKIITWEEFEMAIREEILYDLIYENAAGLSMQMKNDLCNYGVDCLEFQNASKKLEQKMQKYFKNFILERFD